MLESLVPGTEFVHDKFNRSFDSIGPSFVGDAGLVLWSRFAEVETAVVGQPRYAYAWRVDYESAS